jgi:bifunctional ADP-heptose synthase (sugar kinase/adenylyltransferase)
VVADGARAEVLAGLTVVDAVLVIGAEHAGGVLEALRPQVYVEMRGSGAPAAASDAAHRLGIEVAGAGDPDAPRSADVVRRIREGGE